MAKSFYYRLLILAFAMLGLSLFIAIVALLPAYFISISKTNSAQAKLDAQRNIPVPAFDKEALDTIKNLNGKIALVENAEKSKFSVSEQVIRAVLLKKMDSIKINHIAYEEVAGVRKISVYGTAPSRDELLLFRKNLEEDPAFKKVDLPISNFVKGSNIQFFLTLTPA